ncbi:hypothetical protein K7640_08810 [Micromonospora sp. PLK6-60]|uniref:hypothetical protein n=1 Tax=Micromonospora sp. PLK6-60 TaxID=2873383 RepID=UPI001CA6A3B7|nr:hypothetical protein [Micromonospora sp. PLK6-60]MBY8871940.1 hypothetical protein [Micromonospora sp. PLK6-60]
MSARRRWAARAALLLAVAALLPVPPAAAPARAEETGGSAVTVPGVKVAGGEDFSALAVTVDQTRDLVNQAVVVSWTGGTPTPRDRVLGVDFLQVMQCYGDPYAADDPDGLAFRETCQFGAKVDTPVMPSDVPAAAAANANSRELRIDSPDYPAKDPKETLPEDARMVPFRPVSCPVGATGCERPRTPDGSAAQPFPQITDPQTGAEREAYPDEVLAGYFNKSVTNEYPYALTAADGTGRISFEVQNSSLAPDLGCGDPYTDAQGARQPSRPCWLVIVPRGHRHPYTGADVSADDAPQGSPLMVRNWQYRMVVPLAFEPVKGYCSADQAERITAGTELAAEAASAWRPALCATANGPSISYSPIGDDEAARQLLTPSANAPGLIYSSDPVPTTADDPVLVHAPVTLSGVVIAMNIDVNLENVPLPEEVARLRGTAVRDLKLTPRLVAKLLTQSYRRDVPGGGGKALEKNYDSIKRDPEFLDLNPVFADWDRRAAVTLNGLMVPNGSSVAARALWQWILSDRAAKAWLSGIPDGDMVVNPAYGSLFGGEAPDYFPKADRSCYEEREGAELYQLCSQELRPYTGGFGPGAARTLRGDTGAFGQSLNRNVTPPRFEKLPREQPGFRFTMSVTDSASAARYGLFTAQLCKATQNADGRWTPDDCRAPSTPAISAAVATAGPSQVAGVSVIDPATAWATAGAYPLSLLTYAVADTTDPIDARRDYARLLRHAAGDGQRPGAARGLLPEGYVPLPAALRAMTEAAAARLERPAPATSSPVPSAPIAAPATSAPGGATGGGSPPPAIGAPAPPLPPPPATGTVPSSNAPVPGSQAASPQPSTQQAGNRTPGSPVGGLRYAIIVIFAVGLVGGVAGPILRRFAGRFASPGGPE